VRNPFGSEGRAVRFVGAVAALAAVVAGTDAFAPAAAVAAVSVLAVGALGALYVVGGRRPQRIPAAPAHAGGPAERRALLLIGRSPAAEYLSGLRDDVDRILVVSLVSSSPVHHWLSDIDPERAEAHKQMEEAVSRLRALGIDGSGVVGNDDPFTAVDDALRTFGGDEILVATQDPRLIDRLRDRYAIPVTRLTAHQPGAALTR